VDTTQGMEYFNTLRRLNKPVIMLEYKGEIMGCAAGEHEGLHGAAMREFFDPLPDG